MYSEALQHFREYLDTKPADAAQIVETMKLVDDLRKEAQEKVVPQKAPAVIVEAPKAKPPPPAPMIAPKPTVVATPVPAVEEDEFYETPIFWIVTGAVVVAGSAVAIGVATSGPADPYGGSEGFVVPR